MTRGMMGTMRCMVNLARSLHRIFGFTAFRPGQEAVVSDALAGRDVIALMPTGGGKSVCFQLPALLQPGVSIVVSPLIALMQDQVRLLEDNGVAATFINSSLRREEVQQRIAGMLRGTFKLVYLAPERLLMTDFLTGSLEQLAANPGISAFPYWLSLPPPLPGYVQTLSRSWRCVIRRCTCRASTGPIFITTCVKKTLVPMRSFCGS